MSATQLGAGLHLALTRIVSSLPFLSSPAASSLHIGITLRHQPDLLPPPPQWLPPPLGSQPSAFRRWLSDCATHYLPSDLPEAGSESFAQNISINLLPSNIKSGKYLEFPDHRISLPLLLLLLILRHTLGDSRSNIDASYVNLMTEAGSPNSIFLKFFLS